MSRPEYLNCIMTPNIISHIRQDQELYDRDPEAYENQEREAEDRKLQEEEEMRHQFQLQEEREIEQRQNDDLPF